MPVGDLSLRISLDMGSVLSSDPTESEYEYQVSKEPQSDPIEVDDSDSEKELETVREICIMVQDDANRFGNMDVSHDATMGLNNDGFVDSDLDDYSMPSTPSRRDVDTDDHELQVLTFVQGPSELTVAVVAAFGWRGHEPSSNDTIDLQGLFGVLQGNRPPRTVQTPPPRLEPSPVAPVVPPVLARLLTDQGTRMGASTDIYEPLPVEPDWSPNPLPDNQEFLHEEEHMDDESLPDDGD
ncbi:hypothetical protein IW261DRAFT_1568601 [Armillaria novae-zelandiae]|uniref:Uncharacterized protein n=1 Tax=Armillaria novae-zelandiae TaxID=153914 RepID=A0AA39T9S7_9AGAR|nr:hypothetical protein IW261DRAFT_1568601 [Armillaria novae-zelandiae]